MGRNVNVGAKGSRILAAMVGVRRKKDKEAERDITKQNERVLLGFRNAYVFDVSQTKGVDLPTMPEVRGEPGDNIERLAAFLKEQDTQGLVAPKVIELDPACPTAPSGHPMRDHHRPRRMSRSQGEETWRVGPSVTLPDPDRLGEWIRLLADGKGSI